MADGGNDRIIGRFGVKHNKGFVVFYPVAGIDRFGEPGEISILVESGSFADEDGGVSGMFWFFSNKSDILRSITQVER